LTRFTWCAVVLIAAAILVGCSPDQPSADLVLLNGKIVTVDESMPEAQALAVRGDRIVAVGSGSQMRALIDDNTEVIDLQGKLAIPGFIDSHAHLLSLGTSLQNLDLSEPETWSDIVDLVAETAEVTDSGEWILGRGWHQEKWSRVPKPNVDGLPIHDRLSAVTPNNPVILTHASGHACIANAYAMELAGITAETPDPEGGEIVRDVSGDPIGVFRETAKELIDSVYQTYLAQRTPEQIEIDKREAIKLATDECLANGVTTFHDAGSDFATIDLLRRMADSGLLDIRLWVMIGEPVDSLRRDLSPYRIIGAGNNHLTVRAIKQYIDGALGSHGAWLLEPYDDLPSSTGLNVTPLEELEEAAQIARDNNFQLCVHAIGDRANREILNIYEKVLSGDTAAGRRWRVEHAQHIHPADIPRFGQLGVIAAMQGIHCTSDGPWVPKRIGMERAKENAYVWKDLLQSGAIIANGTDAPVENIDPRAGFLALITRELPDGTRFFPGQCLSRSEALRAYTLNGAYAGFEENLKGSITPGKLADIVVLSGDIMTLPDSEITSTAVVYTIVGGEVKYEKGEE
jgi:predicted amidohydrolase YtcJ